MEKQEYQGYTGVWRRLKSGAAVFIRDGEDIKTAVRRNFNDEKMHKKRMELIEKESNLTKKRDEYSDKADALLREKGELSEEYEDAKALRDAYLKARNNAYAERMEHEQKALDVRMKNIKGIKIKQDEFDAIKKSGMTPKQKAEEIKKANSYTSQELKDKYGTDNVDLINAGKEAKDRVTLKKDYNDNDIEKVPKISTASVNNSLGGYKYYTKHGMGPGAVPTDVKISNIKDYDDGMTSFETNRPLSSKELNFYSIENEIKNAEYDAKYGHNSTSDSKIKNYTNSSVQDLRKAMRNMKPYEEEIQIGGRVITKTSNGYGVRNQYDYDDPMTDYSAYVYGFKEKWIIDEAVKKGELKQTELKAKVERFRERKGTSSSNNNGSVESLSKQALIEKIVDDQISRGVAKAENRALQIRARQNMTKSELLKYFK